jgi:hypothetical protein
MGCYACREGQASPSGAHICVTEETYAEAGANYKALEWDNYEHATLSKWTLKRMQAHLEPEEPQRAMVSGHLKNNN